MNSGNREGSIEQSDAIFKKLQNIRSAIEEPSLNDYLPKQRLNSSMHRGPNSQVYRKSLEKRLERMFKQQRKGFIQNTYESQSDIQEDYPPIKQNRYGGCTALTADRMEQKIRELETKYMRPEESHAQSTNIIQNSRKKKKSVHFSIPNKTKDKINPHTHKIQQLERIDSKKFLREVQSLKKQIKQIKQKNQQISDKINNKHNNTQYKKNKEKSKILLREILEKLIRIQTEVEIKERIKYDDRVNIKCKYPNNNQENKQLLKIIEQLKQQLKQQTDRKEVAIEKNRWIEEQLREINRQ